MWQASVEGHKFGFMLKLSSIIKVYDGILDDHWKKLLKSDFFLEQFRKYAYYFEHKLEKTGQEEWLEQVAVCQTAKRKIGTFFFCLVMSDRVVLVNMHINRKNISKDFKVRSFSSFSKK